MASPRSNGSRPAQPWRPARLHVYGVYRRERTPRARADDTSNRRKPATVRYDVRFQVDGHEYRCGFDKKAWADAFADKLQEQYALGCLFDPEARRFVAPDESKDEGPTFYEHAVDHFRRKWPSWSPSRRRDSQRELALACLHLVRDKAPALTVEQRAVADEFLRTAALVVPAPDELDPDARRWDAWFLRWSLLLAEVTDVHLHDFLEAVRTTALDGTARVLAPTTIARTRAVVRAAFTSARRRRLIDWDPWDAVEWRLPPDEHQIDADLVMDPQQVFALAAACGAINPRYECFVLIQGFCGLRPGETRDLRRRDLALDDTPAEVTVRGTYTDTPARFFDDGESRERPLKGRGRRSRRTIPIPRQLVPRLHEHLDTYVGAGADALVFTIPNGRRIDLTNFNRDVWAPAREAVFPEDSPLRKVRRHDLRHSAITAWLNRGVTLKTAQRWSGHRTASVLLDTYLGVMRDDAGLSLARVEELLDEALTTQPRPESVTG